MLKNYFKIAWRSMMKNKVFSFINVFGLSVGLTCCMLICLYIWNETHYDNYHRHIADLYQVGTTFVKQDQDKRTANTPAPMAQALKSEYPEIEDVARLTGLFAEDKTLLQFQDKNGPLQSFYEDKGYLADASFFKLFTYHFTEGDAGTALEGPNTVVLNEEIARKFFGSQPALNKVIHISSNTNGDMDFVVKGVFRPVDQPSQIQARFFVSIKGGGIDNYIQQGGATNMVNNNMFSTFLLLKPGSDAAKLEAKLPAFVEKYIGSGLRQAGYWKKQFLIPFRDIHLKAGIPNDLSPVGSTTYLYILGSIALFTLLIACINFMNLSTARSSKRSAEVGVRKVLGAERGSLIRQFLGESVLMAIVAFVLAFLLMELLLPAFSAVSGRQLSFSFRDDGWLLLSFFGLAIVAGLLAGSYPALYLSSFAPVKVLKGKISNSLAAVSLRKALVVFQFVISVVLIIASVIINDQMSFMRNKDLGFAKDQQLIIPLRSNNAKMVYASLRNEVRKNGDVLQAGGSLYYPGIFNPSDMGIYKEGKTVDDGKTVRLNTVDETFLQTLDIRPVAGRLFSNDFLSDTNNRLILNESAVREIGFASAREAIGSTVHSHSRSGEHSLVVVGVVKDFHFQDLHVPIEPYGFQLSSDHSFNYLIVHARANSIGGLLKRVESSWHQLNPTEPFEYSFLDDDFQKNYEAESRLSSVVRNFTIIAILISCLGLFGLATFSAEQRTKEIGVRKVLGASVGSIIALVSKEFIRLVVIAVLIASPLAWWAMHRWLQDFAYRTSIGWTVFVITASLAVCIALVTISLQAIRAAVANPVKSLRTE